MPTTQWTSSETQGGLHVNGSDLVRALAENLPVSGVPMWYSDRIGIA